MVKSVVKHIFDRYFLFSKPPEIRTVEGLSAVFAFVRCEYRLCSQTTRAPSCATPGYLFNFSRFCVEVGQTVVKLKIHAFLSFYKTPKVRIRKAFRDFCKISAIIARHAPKAGALPIALHPGCVFRTAIIAQFLQSVK